MAGAMGGMTGALAPALPVRARPAWRVARADEYWDGLLLCVLVYVLTAVGRVHQLFPVVGMLRPAILSGLCAIGLYAIDRTVERAWGRVWLPATRTLAVLLVWMMLSIPGALVSTYSVGIVVDGILKTVVMFVVMVGAVRGPRDVERLAAAYLVSAVVYAAVVTMRFDLGAGEAWRLGDLYYYDANDFAVLTVTAMPLAFYFFHEKRGLRRALAAGALALLALSFVWSGSRGGFIALLAVVGYVLVRYTAIPFRRRAGVTALVALVVLGTASSQYWTQMGTILSDADYNRTDETGRTQIWKRGIGYMIHAPIFGVGAGNFPVAEGTLSPLADRAQFGRGVRWNAAHNTLIQAGAELGIPGLVLFVAFIAGGFRALRPGRAEPASGVPPELTQLLRASLLGFVVGAMFLSLAYQEMLYTLVAIAVAAQKVNTWR